MKGTEEVARKVGGMWPDPATQERVMAKLQGYGEKEHEREASRVRLAILKLCDSREDGLPELVAAAKRDYRDVLMWAEYPSEGRAVWTVGDDLSAEERRRLEDIREEDRRQYQDWLKK